MTPFELELKLREICRSELNNEMLRVTSYLERMLDMQARKHPEAANGLAEAKAFVTNFRLFYGDVPNSHQAAGLMDPPPVRRERMQSHTVVKARTEAVVAKLREGYEPKDIAKEMGLSRHLVDQAAGRHGLRATTITNDLLDRVAAGGTIADAARALGMNLNLAYQKVHRARKRGDPRALGQRAPVAAE